MRTLASLLFTSTKRHDVLSCNVFQAALQRELAAAKADIRDITESRNQTIEDTRDLADTVEMITLDKEMAEERAETLQLELEQARETIEELT